MLEHEVTYEMTRRERGRDFKLPFPTALSLFMFSTWLSKLSFHIYVYRATSILQTLNATLI